MRSVGYRQVWAWLETGEATPFKRLIETGVAATRQLAKRQLTWLRGMEQRQIVDCLARDRMEQIERKVREAWSAQRQGH